MSAKTKTTKESQPSGSTSKRLRGLLPSLKPFLSLLAVIAVVCLAFSQTHSYLWRAWQPLKVYESTSLGFRLAVPQSWKAKQADEYQQIVFAPPKDADPAQKDSAITLSRIQTANLSGAESAEEYFSNLRTTLDENFKVSERRTSLEQYRRLSQHEVSIGGKPALLVDIAIDNFSHRDDRPGQGKIVFIYVDSEHQYTLTTSADADDRPFLARQASIIDSFQPL
jgi:hypothetical protein